MTHEEYFLKRSAFSLMSRTIRMDPPQALALWGGDIDTLRKFALALRQECTAHEEANGLDKPFFDELDQDYDKLTAWIKSQLQAK